MNGRPHTALLSQQTCLQHCFKARSSEPAHVRHNCFARAHLSKPFRSVLPRSHGANSGGWRCVTAANGWDIREPLLHRSRSRRCHRTAASKAKGSGGGKASKQAEGFGAANEAEAPSSFQPPENGDRSVQDSAQNGTAGDAEGPPVYNSAEAEQRSSFEAAARQEEESGDVLGLTNEEALLMEDQVAEYVQVCQDRYQVDGLVEIGLSGRNMPAVLLRHPNGSEAMVYLHGANVGSWTRPDGRELLYLRQGNLMNGVSPVRGGIPIAFPQVGRGELPTDGFMSSVHWSIADTGVSDPEVASDRAPSVALYTESDDATMEIWPHSYEAMYTVSLMENDDFPDTAPSEESSAASDASGAAGRSGPNFAAKSRLRFDNEKVDDNPLQLRCVLEIMNTGEDEMVFTTALQTHFAILPLGDYPGNSSNVRVLGLGGKHALDFATDPSNPKLTTDPDDYVYFGDQVVDRVYVDTEDTDMLMCPGDRSHIQLFNRQGFRDCAISNPFNKAREEYKDFITMQSARVARPVKLQPGESFVGEMVIRSYNTMWERPMFEYERGDSQSTEPMPDIEGVDRRPAARLEGVEAERIDMEE